MSKAAARASAGTFALLLILGAGACSVSTKPAGATVPPTTNPPAAGAQPTVVKTALPPDWPGEAPVPAGMTIVDVKANQSGTTVLGNAKGDDAVKAGEELKAEWEKNGVLITTSSDQNKTFTMAALSKDGKTQLTATIAKGPDGPLQIILTKAPAE